MAAGGVTVAAAIDVGSNSVLLLTVTVAPGGVARAVDEAVATTRLGTGLRAGGALDPDAIRRTRANVVDFAARARAQGAESVWAFATGAARRASDGAVFAGDLAGAADIPVEILSGAREAALAHDAAAHGLGLSDGALLTVDLGGGTTELTLGLGGTIQASVSLSLGALALTETCGADLYAVRRHVADALATTDVPARAVAAGAAVVASGGTVTALAAQALGLARYEPRRVHGLVLGADRLGALAAAGADGTALDPGRAVLLPAGACILDGVLAATQAARLRVSDHGVRHAYLREQLARRGVVATMERLWD